MFDSRDETGRRRVARTLWLLAGIVLAVVAVLSLSPDGDESPERTAGGGRPQALRIPPPHPAETMTPPAAPEAAVGPVTGESGGDVDAPVGESPAPVRPELPALDASDPVLRQALAGVTAPDAGLDRLLVGRDLIRRFVVMAVNIEADKLPRRHMPVRPPAGRFEVVRQADGRLLMAPGNARRYRPYVRALTAIDPDGLVGVYRRFAPLFAEAWRDLGLGRVDPERRLLGAIDVLLAAPEIAGPVVLKRHSVNYRFADPAIEALPESQRLMIRIGHDNARRVRQWLRAVRAALIAPTGGGR